MSPGWTAVIALSVAVMAAVQVTVLVALAIGLRRMHGSLQQLEQRVDTTLGDLGPRLTAVIEETRATSAQANALLGEMRTRLDGIDEAARAVRDGFHRVATGLSWAATTLPGPMKVSGPAAMAAWAGVRAVRGLADRARSRRARRDAEYEGTAF